MLSGRFPTLESPLALDTTAVVGDAGTSRGFGSGLWVDSGAGEKLIGRGFLDEVVSD